MKKEDKLHTGKLVQLFRKVDGIWISIEDTSDLILHIPIRKKSIVRYDTRMKLRCKPGQEN